MLVRTDTPSPDQQESLNLPSPPPVSVRESIDIGRTGRAAQWTSECYGTLYRQSGPLLDEIAELGLDFDDEMCAMPGAKQKVEEVVAHAYAELDRIWVKSRGVGKGSYLMAQFLARARELGAQNVIVLTDVYEDQDDGFDLISWYEKCGFEKLVGDGSDWFMVKSLSGAL